MRIERPLYNSTGAYLLNQVLFPLKMVVPQPVVAHIPGLTTNEDIRVGLVLSRVRGRLLDIGCGLNRVVLAHRAAGGEGTGVDVYGWEGCDLVVEDTSKLEFSDGSFDTITFVACLNHIPNRVEVLQEARRLLAPGGQVVLTILPPGLSRVWHVWAFWDDDQHERGLEEGEVFGFAREELQEVLHQAGFQPLEVSTFSWGINQLWVCRPNATTS